MAALLALTIQFVGAFGHFHQEWLGEAAIAAITPGDHQQREPDQDHGNHPESCAICTAASLSQTLSPPAAPALNVPAFAAIEPAAAEASLLAASPYRGPFQSRAPPIS